MTMRRRQFLGAVAGSASVALAGCSGDTSGSDSTPTTDSCTDDRSQEFCQSQDFVTDVRQHVESIQIEETEPPRLFGGGVFIEDGEPNPRKVVVQMASDAPDRLERTPEVVDGDSIPEPTRVNIGYVANGFAEYVSEVPHLISIIIPVYDSADENEYYGDFTILRGYAEEFNNNEQSDTVHDAEWYLNTILKTWNPA
jgi:hypothetical protein